MIEQTSILVISPTWILLLLPAYVVSGLAYFQTDNVVIAVLSFIIWTIATVAGIYWYYGIPF